MNEISYKLRVKVFLSFFFVTKGSNKEKSFGNVPIDSQEIIRDWFHLSNKKDTRTHPNKHKASKITH